MSRKYHASRVILVISSLIGGSDVYCGISNIWRNWAKFEVSEEADPQAPQYLAETPRAASGLRELV